MEVCVCVCVRCDIPFEGSGGVGVCMCAVPYLFQGSGGVGVCACVLSRTVPLEGCVGVCCHVPLADCVGVCCDVPFEGSPSSPSFCSGIARRQPCSSPAVVSSYRRPRPSGQTFRGYFLTQSYRDVRFKSLRTLLIGQGCLNLGCFRLGCPFNTP